MFAGFSLRANERNLAMYEAASIFGATPTMKPAPRVASPLPNAGGRT
jgi:hypothetical protein